jgi:hypothetical protein
MEKGKYPQVEEMILSCSLTPYGNENVNNLLEMFLDLCEQYKTSPKLDDFIMRNYKVMTEDRRHYFSTWVPNQMKREIRDLIHFYSGNFNEIKAFIESF